jgi:hypothetical protein
MREWDQSQLSLPKRITPMQYINDFILKAA